MVGAIYRRINMSEANHGGKGDRSRVKNKEAYSSNFDKIFRTQLKGVLDEQEDRRKDKLDEVGLLKNLDRFKDSGGAGT